MKNSYDAAIEVINKPLSRKKKQWLDRTIGLAYGSDCSMRLGAIIVKSGSLLSTGINSMRNNPNDLYYGGTSVHAEMAALRELRGPDNTYASAKGATIFVARIWKNGTTANARPCDKCYKALNEAGVSTIIYTTDTEYPAATI